MVGGILGIGVAGLPLAWDWDAKGAHVRRPQLRVLTPLLHLLLLLHTCCTPAAHLFPRAHTPRTPPACVPRSPMPTCATPPRVLLTTQTGAPCATQAT